MTAFTVNGTAVTVDVPGSRRLLDVLREDLRMTGAKEGCGEGECGACSVLIDGEVVNSCLVAVGQVDGCAILTVEGLDRQGMLAPLQQAFIDHGAAQCGICTPGMLMAAHALLERNATPSHDDVREAIAGNLCRCTGYTKIIDAVLACRTHGS
ncbi:MAG: (2Fe-2S)-binding protein [Gemmatimonadota bacterium]|nr:(2Fe-2S)-binding protein [Gemmatimonadota bacterium]MDH3366829.1 (2Fe-2S)-binding protein [Gemmatimonadota bacterium]MDH3479645.1 (2Fe-2S)-binding protein [Gemmatimonadota bacterium]MDH5548912.1 (2Fe-2S)-binding protein [Gemmatimonadota bacterium]